MQTKLMPELVKFLKQTFGNKVWDDTPEQTAERWIKAMQEFTPTKEIDFKQTVFPTMVNQLITVRGIEFASLCAHHLFPFFGIVHVGYIPNRLMIGVSKIPRIVHHWAHRPSTQETLTRNIATHLKNLTDAHGVAVVVSGTHTCMACRGVKEHNAQMITTEMRGVFLTAEAARSEFLSVVLKEQL